MKDNEDEMEKEDDVKDKEDEMEAEEDEELTSGDLARLVSSHLGPILRQLSDIDQRLNHIERKMSRD